MPVEAFFERGDSVARVEYRFYGERVYFDINVDLFFRNSDRLVRIDFPTALKGEYFGQIAYGAEKLYEDGRECVAQRYVGVRGADGQCFAVLNKSCYGSRFSDGTIGVTLVRGAGYCVHPINDRPLIPEQRYIKRMDQCEHGYHFRIALCKTEGDGEIGKRI